MKHAKKMKLVDINSTETFDDTNVKNSNQHQPQPISKQPTVTEMVEVNSYDTLSFLDRHMKAILESKNLSDFDKWTQYNQALTRYLYWIKEKNTDSDAVNKNLKKVVDTLNETICGEKTSVNSDYSGRSLNRTLSSEANHLDMTWDDFNEDGSSSSYRGYELNTAQKQRKRKSNFDLKPLKRLRSDKQKISQLLLNNRKTAGKQKASQIFKYWKTANA